MIAQNAEIEASMDNLHHVFPDQSHMSWLKVKFPECSAEKKSDVTTSSSAGSHSSSHSHSHSHRSTDAQSGMSK